MRRALTVLASIVAAAALTVGLAGPSSAATPGAPTNLTAEQLGATAYPGPNLKLSWAAPRTGDAPTAYRIYKDGKLLATTAERQINVHRLKKGQAYAFEVRSVNRDGAGGSASVSVVAQMPPSITLDVQAVPGDTVIDVSWTPPVDSGGTAITGYEVTTSPSTRAQCASTGTTSCQLTGLRNGTSYEITVQAKNQAWPDLQGVESESVYATPGTAPSGPRAFQATGVGSSSVRLAWTAPAVGASTITGYDISVFEERGPSARELYAVVHVGANQLDTTIDGLTPGYEYYFGIRATTASAVGAMTENVIVNPIGLPAAPDLVVIAGVGSGAVKVEWEEPDPNGGAAPSSYVITARPVDRPSMQIAVTECTTKVPYEQCVTDFVFTGLTNGVTYSFTVAAKNTFGLGPESTHPAVATPLA